MRIQIGVLLAAAFIIVKGNRDLIYKINLKSRLNTIDLVPERYLRSPDDRVKVILPDSGKMEGSLLFGTPPKRVDLIVDLNDLDTHLPANLLESYQSDTLSIGSDGVWRDVIDFGGLKVEEGSFGFVHDESGQLGLGSVNDTTSGRPSFMETVLGMEVLGMSIKSLYLSRMDGKVTGELWLGESPNHPKDALVRFNPVSRTTASGAWLLSLTELRVDGHSSMEFGDHVRAVIDCSTPMTILPTSIFRKLAAMMEIEIKENASSTSAGMLISRPMACEVLVNLPILRIGIATDEYIWDAAHYLLPSDDHGNCILGIMGYDAQIPGQTAGESSLIVLGSLFLLDRVAVFDHSTLHVGLSDYELDEDFASIKQQIHELSQQEL